MPEPKLPTDVGPLNPRLREWMRQHVEQAARARSQVSVTFPEADTDVRVRHRLPGLPTGYRMIRSDSAGSVYDGSRAGDRHYLYLRSNTAGITVTIEVS